MIIFIAIIAAVAIAYFIHRKSTTASDSSNPVSEQLLSERISFKKRIHRQRASRNPPRISKRYRSKSLHKQRFKANYNQ